MDREEHSMVDVAPTVSEILGLSAPAQATGAAVRAIVADLAVCERVVILAPDAFGDFAWQLWREEMPFLKSLHEKRSILLRSVMPSVTPVNFATMVTGMDLDGHGVSSKNRDFACETLFDVVRRADGTSAGVGITGYTGCDLQARIADIHGDAGDGTDDDVADKVIEIAEAHRPQFIIAQLGRVDDVFHKYGPSSPSVVPMLQATDRRLRRLAARLCALRYGVIILADHGQHDLDDRSGTEKKGGHGTEMDKDCLVPCTWTW